MCNINRPGFAVIARSTYLSADGDPTNEVQAISSGINVVFPKDPSQLGHIFREATGHLVQDTAANRELLLYTISPDNFIKIDQWDNEVYSRMLPEGTEVWAVIREGIIQNGGINIFPLWH